MDALNERKGGQARTRVTGLTSRFDEVSAMTSDRTILITGVTGNQGGAVAQALQGTGFYLRGLTRMPDSERAAREAGVEHYVYTSVGSAHKRTGIPHFDNKWRIEETVR